MSAQPKPLMAAFGWAAETSVTPRRNIPGSGTQFLLVGLACALFVSILLYLSDVVPIFAIKDVEFTEPDVVTIALGVVILLRALVKGFHGFPKVLTVSLAAYFGATLISALGAADKLRAVAAVVQMFEFVLLVWCISLITSYRNVLRVVYFILAALAFESLFAAWQFLSDDTSNRGMPHGTFANNIKYSSFCGVGAAMCYGLYVSSENKNARLGYLLTMGVLLFGSILGQERHPWLAFMISGIAVTFLSGAKRRKARMMQFVGAILVVVIVVATVPSLRDRVVSRFEETQLDRVEQNTLLSRLAIWGVAWSFFVQHPILGVGPKSFTSLIPSILSYQEMGNLEVAEPHNVWIGVLAEGGLIGFITYVGLCVSIILLAYRRLEDPLWKPWRPFLFAYLSYHFFMFTMSSNYFTKAEGHMHFLMVGLMLGLLRREASHRNSENLNTRLAGDI